MVPEIQSERDKKFLSFWVFFCPFIHPLMILNIKILKKVKKMPGDIIFLYIHVYHKWRSYDIWFLRYQAWGTEFFAILDHFLPFYLPNKPKNQNFEKMKKKRLEILSFYTSTPSIIITWCMVPEIWSVMGKISCHLDRFLPFYTPNNLKNKNFEKLEKKHMQISSFYTSIPKIMIISYTVP